jgi:hypothetical protein
MFTSDQIHLVAHACASLYRPTFSFLAVAGAILTEAIIQNRPQFTYVNDHTPLDPGGHHLSKLNSLSRSQGLASQQSPRNNPIFCLHKDPLFEPHHAQRRS